MKHKFLKIIVLILSVISIKKVYALENSILTTNYIDNVYAYHYKDGVLRSYGKLPYRYQNGVIAYCIEPDRVINTNSYSVYDDWSVSGYDENTKKQMELIAHYGYEYPGHNTKEYYMATQELIWLFSDDSIKWMDTYSTDGSLGNKINIENEKNEIKRLIEKHNTLPYINNKYFTKFYGETLGVVDLNGVLDNYDVITDLNYEVKGNLMQFYIDKMGTHKVTLKTKNSNNRTTKVYKVNGFDTQMMATFGLSDIKETSFEIRNCQVHVKITKKDKNSNEIIKQDKIKFSIKNINTGSIQEYETNNNGYFYINLYSGDYEIEELKAPNGYIINKDKITFKLYEGMKVEKGEYDIDFYNEKPLGKINIIKKDEEGNDLYGVEIGLFDKNKNKIQTLITNDKNNSFENLELGTYYIKEIKTIEGYQIDEKEYKVDLVYKDDKTMTIEKDLKIINNKSKCDITYITSAKINNIEINVFNDKNKLVFTGKTDENGKIVIKNLPYGKYIIKQIKVPRGYILNNEEYVFYVNDSTCSSIINVQNKKTIMPITSTSINKSIYASLLLIVTGICNYVKKNN